MSALQPAAKPFVKWAGGKRFLLPELLKHVPDWPLHRLRHIGTYYEPFVGGGAMFFAMGAGAAVLADTNEELMNAFRVVKEDVETLITELRTPLYANTSEAFYAMRANDPKDWHPHERAARFIYLNRVCFNGLYRVNSKGKFNAPFGKYKNPTICDGWNLRACSDALKYTGLVHDSFEKVVEQAKPGDFVYFDPPYDVLSPTANFTSYTPGGFGWEEQLLLRQCCEELEKKGVSFLLSNADTERINVLYGGKFFIRKVQSPRAINSKSEKRGLAKEVLIYNREVEGVV
jgi:DNA adenine methylase